MNRQQYIWKQQEKHKEYENINALFYQMVKLSGFVLEPIILGEVFFRNLQLQKESDKNKQTARNMSKIYSILCQYNFINGKLYHNENGFSVSPSVWQKHCIGRDALDTSIKKLKAMNLIDFDNSCYYGKKERRKRFYTVNRNGLEYLLHQAEKIKGEEQDKDIQLYEDFLDYTNRKDFVTDYQEERAFKQYKTQRKCGAIKVAPKEIKSFQKNLENLEEII